MRLGSVYTGLASGFLIGSSLLIGIITSTPQAQADNLIYIGLIAGFVLATASLLSFFGLAIRKSITGANLTSYQLANAIRQGLEVAVLLVVLASLWFLTGLSWWEVILLVLAMLFAELAIMFKRSN
ncbi:hypothetical protein KC644_01205 [Candidatus Berkelbacteria bacterium]|nr:hypothetical protein [Candidatus Berkelbacteria bacterium]